MLECNNQIQGCFVFSFPDGFSEQPSRKVFRDPFGPYLLTRIAKLLSARGFDVTGVRPGRACDAGFSVCLGVTTIKVALLVTRPRQNVIECGLLTWPRTSFFQRVWYRSWKPDFEEWSRLSAAIDTALREDLRDLNLASLLRLTRTQAEARWAVGRSG